VGSALPLVAWLVCKAVRAPGFYVVQFFAGFCLIVNGIYLSVVSFLNAADAGDLMRHGTPQWVLVAFGVIAFPAGLILWNGLGPRFGLGASAKTIERKVAAGVFAFLVATVATELIVNSR
jgi:hypothetical protein